MKQLLAFLLLTLISFTGYAQNSNHNFQRNGDGIVWDCTFVDSSKSTGDILTHFLLSEDLKDIRQVGDVIVAHVIKWRPNYKAAGYTDWNIPLYIARSSGFSGTVKIYASENRYRVVFSNIVIHASSNPDDPFFPTDSYLNDLAYNFRKDKFKPSFTAGIDKLDKLFQVKFKIRE